MADFLLAPRDFFLHLEIFRKAAKFETLISSALFFAYSFTLKHHHYLMLILTTFEMDLVNLGGET